MNALPLLPKPDAPSLDAVHGCLLFLLFFAFGAGLAAGETLAESGPEIVRGQNDGEWQELFAALAAKGSVSAQFTERRVFALRKKPVEVQGQLRLVPNRGLSLDYGERTMIVDATGVLLRDRRGRSRVVKPDDRAPAPNALLLPILTFDWRELEKTFAIFGARADGRWRLDFKPRAAGPDAAAGEIVVHGAGDHIHQIDLRPKQGVQIAIVLTDVKTGVTFSDEELRRFFR